MASSPITSWKIGGKTVKTVADFILGGSKITEDSECSHEIQRHFLPWSLNDKEFACQAGGLGSIPGLGRSPGGGHGNPLKYSCLENPVDRGAWWAAVHRIAQSQTRLKQLSMRACTGEGNGNPLQYSCRKNPRDGEAWWVAVHGVAQSRT